MKKLRMINENERSFFGVIKELLMIIFRLRCTTKCVIDGKHYIFFVPIMVNFGDKLLFDVSDIRRALILKHG